MLRTHTAAHSSAVGNRTHAWSDLSYCWTSLWQNIYGNKGRDWFLCLLVSETLVCALLAPCFLLPREAENHVSWSVWKRGLMNSWGQETERGRCWGSGATFKGISPRWPISSKQPHLLVSQTSPTVPSTGHQTFNTWACRFPIQTITWPNFPSNGRTDK